MTAPWRRARGDRPHWDPNAYPGQRRVRRLLSLVAVGLVVVVALLLIFTAGSDRRPRIPLPTATGTPAASLSAPLAAGSVAGADRGEREHG
jgi:hypothetical protein